MVQGRSRWPSTSTCGPPKPPVWKTASPGKGTPLTPSRGRSPARSCLPRPTTSAGHRAQLRVQVDALDRPGQRGAQPRVHVRLTGRRRRYGLPYLARLLGQAGEQVAVGAGQVGDQQVGVDDVVVGVELDL